MHAPLQPTRQPALTTTPPTNDYQASDLLDNRPEAVRQRQTVAALHQSPRQVAQRQAVATLHQSPRQVAQRQASTWVQDAGHDRRAVAGTAPVVQRQPVDEEVNAAPADEQIQNPETQQPASEEDLGQGALLDIQQAVRVDMDGDGQLEQHTLRFGGEVDYPDLMIYSDPVLLEAFIASQPALYNDARLTALVEDIMQLQAGGAISLTKKSQITLLLGRVAARVAQLLQPQAQVPRALLPPSFVRDYRTRTISDNGVQETVNDGLLIEPLTILPGAALGGTAVQNSNTPYMQALRTYAGYIRGHMLNSKVHGPGDDWNLIPISRKMNSKMAGNSEIEGQLKKWVWSENKVVSYQVTPSGWGGYQGASNARVEQQLPTNFHFRVEEMALNTTPGLDRADPANWRNTGTILFSKNYTHTKPADTTGYLNLQGPAQGTLPSGRLYLDETDRFEEVPGRPNFWLVSGTIVYESLIGLPKLGGGRKRKTIDGTKLLTVPTLNGGGLAATHSSGNVVEVYGDPNLNNQIADDQRTSAEDILYKGVENLLNFTASEYDRLADSKQELKPEIINLLPQIEELFTQVLAWRENARAVRLNATPVGNQLIAEREEWSLAHADFSRARLALDGKWRDVAGPGRNPYVPKGDAMDW